MNVSAPFIRRPVATTLLATAIVLAGSAAFTQLPVAPLPRTDNPTINVSAGLPGGSPETMASAVATPLERRFGRIAGVSEITSTSVLGSSSLTLQFDLDRDVDSAARDVMAAMNAAGGDLPANLPNRPNYRKVNPADAPILIVALTSKTLTMGQVFDTANTVLAQKISQVPGVGQVTVGGGQQPAVRVSVDPSALAGVGLSLEDVRNALSRATSNQPKGALSGPVQTASIDSNSQLTVAAQYRPLIIGYQNGAAVRLGDVAHVFDDVENQRAAGWVDGIRAIPVIIRRQPGANIIDVIDRVKALLPEIAASINPSIDVTIALDRSTTIRASVQDVEITLLISIMLVVLVVFLFLRSGWATTIPSVAVPLSLMGTFGVMYLFGYSLDNLSLMALTISTGFVVDDAIVVTENVTRFIEQGDTPMQAAFKGAKQIGFTIVSITVSLLAVFIPILLMGGMVGRIFREFAVTLSIAIAMSAVVSLTLTPMMASRMLRGDHEKEHGRFYHLSERAFAWMQDTYASGLKWVLDHEWLMVLVTLATVGFTIYLYVVVPKGLFPQQDTGSIAGGSQAPQDISFPAMKARTEALCNVLKQDPNISHFVSFIGQGNTGFFYVQLKPWGKERKLTADQVIGELRPKLARVEGITLFLQNVQDVRLGGRLSAAQYQYTISDANLDELNEWSPKVLEKLRTLPQLRDVNTDQQTSGLRLDVTIDRDTAARMGITLQNVDDTLYDAFGQRQVATMYTQLNQYRVVEEVKPEFQATPDQIEKLYVRAADGSQVPLKAFAKVTEAKQALSVNHQGQFPAVTISFNLAPGAALGQAVDIIGKATREIGLPASAHGSFQGTAQAFQQSLASEPFLVAFALIAVYIVLGVLYESYVHPITILSTLPSAGVGALLALLVVGMDFSIIALIGIILLIGIVKKNAIMMIDFALEAEREQGLSTRDAIYQACLLRFRPIMMTTMAALLGGVPLAIGHGAGAELRQPLGITIVGGLLFSQMLTLLTTPVIYVALDTLSKKRKSRVSPASPQVA
ncbi:MAG TPA: multidrug efflux RND transporter permease subunit [Myxococcales bacterium]|nr:multidrug efflux RND transporter permease subunit [Myxococcales bacterium]